MSASNWAKCPRCKFRAERHAEELKQKVDQTYGEVPQDEWEKTKAEAIAAETAFEQSEPTMREDYEFYGTEDGTVKLYYRGCCTACGLSLDFEYERDFPGVET